jgi:hypothetical protein
MVIKLGVAFSTVIDDKIGGDVSPLAGKELVIPN